MTLRLSRSRSSEEARSPLWEPGRIGNLEVRNRFIMAAMGGISEADEEGFATDKTRDYFAARARGGVGLIVVGSCAVDAPLGASGRPRLAFHTDEYRDSMGRVVEAIHRHGAAAAMQLQHAGPAHPSALTGLQPVAASPITRPIDHLHPKYWGPRELSVEEIADIVRRFAETAVRARSIGFDAIEVHAAHRYLINSFLSPYWNHRTDEYGGDLQGRTRFLVEILSAIKAAVGSAVPVWCKINGEEPTVTGGIDLALARATGRILQAAGSDALTISTWPPLTPSNPVGYSRHLTSGVKDAVSIPVIAVGRIEHALGDRLLRDGNADFVALGRALVADPEYPNKLRAGRHGDITPCVYCNTCNNNPTEAQRRASNRMRACTVNPALGRERDYEITRVAQRRRILIVGGGPAGLEAARVAALRGHEVTLYERQHRLGGRLVLAAVLRRDNQRILDYLIRQTSTLGIDVRLGVAVDRAMIDRLRPDVVVVATGAMVESPDVEGSERPNVLSIKDVEAMIDGRLRRGSGLSRANLRRVIWRVGGRLMRSAIGLKLLPTLMRLRPLGKRVVIVGKQLPGIELAAFLAERGTRVTVVDTIEAVPFAEPPMPVLRQFLEEKLRHGPSDMVTVAGYDAVTTSGLSVIDSDGTVRLIEADTIVFTGEYHQDVAFADSLRDSGLEVHSIGDCAQPYGILEAIDAGSRVARLV